MADDVTAYEVKTALLCDGVRKEITGQETIVGVYGDRFRTDVFPFNFLPTLYLRIKFNKPDTYPTQFRVLQNDNTQLIHPPTFPVVSSEGSTSTTIVLGPLPLNIQSEGVVSFSIKVVENEWEKICQISFEKGQFKPPIVTNPRVSTVSSPLP